jgi:hypothetical protein
MTILEIAIANQVLARRREKSDLGYYDDDGLKVLMRIAAAFAGFGLFLLWLQSAVSP